MLCLTVRQGKETADCWRGQSKEVVDFALRGQRKDVVDLALRGQMQEIVDLVLKGVV